MFFPSILIFLYRNVMAQLASKTSSEKADTNGNHDSGYAPSNLEDILAVSTTPPGSPHKQATVYVNKNAMLCKPAKNGSSSTTKSISAAKNKHFSPNASPKKEPFR
jgi:dopamine receptor D2